MERSSGPRHLAQKQEYYHQICEDWLERSSDLSNSGKFKSQTASEIAV